MLKLFSTPIHFPCARNHFHKQIRSIPIVANRPLSTRNFSSNSLSSSLAISSHLLNSVHRLAKSYPHQPTTIPLYQTATFSLDAQQLAADTDSSSSSSLYDYTRSGNPTRSGLEQLLSELEVFPHPIKCYSHTFNSGMAAISSCVFDLLRPGDEILSGRDLYGGTHRIFEDYQTRGFGRTHFADLDDADSLCRLLASNSRVKLVWLEFPSNPRLESIEIDAICEKIKKINQNCIIAVDNSILSSFNYQPLLNASIDIAVQSSTKYLNGHSDSTGGVLSTRSAILSNKIAWSANARGTAMAPFDCWLTIRGLKTLPIRIREQQKNSEFIVQFLRSLSNVGISQIFGPEISIRDKKEEKFVVSSIISIESDWDLPQFVSKLKLFHCSVSFGSVNSSVNIPLLMSHKSIQNSQKQNQNQNQNQRQSNSGMKSNSNLIRLSIGIENHEDLIQDLKQAIEAIKRKKIE